MLAGDVCLRLVAARPLVRAILLEAKVCDADAAGKPLDARPLNGDWLSPFDPREISFEIDECAQCGPSSSLTDALSNNTAVNSAPVTVISPREL